MAFLGGIFYIGLLLINAVAVLSEDRFLARSACPSFYAHTLTPSHPSRFAVGWSTVQPPNNVGFQQNYDQGAGYGNPAQDIGMKGRLINLISAVRTVMRSTCFYFRLRSGYGRPTSSSTTYRGKHRSHHLRTHTRKIKVQNVKGKHICSAKVELISIHSASHTHRQFGPRNL